MIAPEVPPESPPASIPASPKPASDDTSGYTMHDTLHALIKKQVLSALGSPDDLFRVQVRSVGAHSFRANVFVGKDATSARVANSFFLSADSDGNILSSSPKISRLY